jgi:ATP-dependent Clp protease ATP-binding subunit ClpA
MAIKWDKFTVKSQEALQVAQGSAAENGNPEVLPLHLMLALMEDKEGAAGARESGRAGAAVADVSECGD